MAQIKNIKEVTEPLKEEILKGDVHTIEEMKAWLKPFGYSDAINDAAINFILREFVMSKVSCDEMRNMDMIVELLHRNNYIDDKQYQSIYADCEELVKILVTRCKRINEEIERK